MAVTLQLWAIVLMLYMLTRQVLKAFPSRARILCSGSARTLHLEESKSSMFRHGLFRRPVSIYLRWSIHYFWISRCAIRTIDDYLHKIQTFQDIDLLICIAWRKDCKDMQKVELRQRWLCHSQPELRKIYLVITTPAGRKVFNPVDASFFFLPLLRCAEDFRM